MPYSDLSTLSFFDKFPNDYFLFVTATDINTTENPYYFKALFRNLKTGEYIYTEDIHPEFIKNKYFVGCVYQNRGFVKASTNVEKAIFRVNKNPDNPLVKLVDVINTNDFIEMINVTHEDYRIYDEFYNVELNFHSSKLNEHKQSYRDFLRQYAHVEVYDNFILIIPCYLIAVEYYLLSRNIKNAVMQGMIEKLYYDDSVYIEKIKDGETIANIKFKVNIGKANINHIARFVTDPYALNRFNFIVTSLRSNLPFQAIHAKFPVNTPFDLSLNYIKIGEDENKREKYLALNIRKENAPFKFDKLVHNL